MGLEILEGLPTVLPRGRVVLVVGPDGMPGLNTLKSQISDLNRVAEWIRVEFRNNVSESLVTDKVAVLLTMNGVGQGTLSNMRKAASKFDDLYCPKRALTLGEVKEVLFRLYQVRNNGNGDHSLPGKGEAQRLDEIKADAQRQAEQTLSAIKSVPTTEKQVNAVVSVDVPVIHDRTDVESALKSLDKFSGVIEEVQLAMLTIADELKVVTAERDDLRRQMEVKNKEIVDLNVQLVTSQDTLRGNAGVVEENQKLKGKVEKLQNALDNFERLIKAVRG